MHALKEIWFNLMLQRVMTISRIVVSITIFLALKILLSYVALSSFAKVSVDAEFDHDDVIAIYYSSGIDGKGFREQESKRSKGFRAGLRSVRTVDLEDHVVRSTGHYWWRSKWHRQRFSRFSSGYTRIF